MATCNYCGAEIGSNISTCPNCGSAVSQSSTNGADAPLIRVNKKTCLNIAKILLIITAVCAFLFAPYNILNNIISLIDLDSSVETAMMLYAQYAQTFADLGIEIAPLGEEFFTPVMIATCIMGIIGNICTILLGIWCIIIAIRCTKIRTKKAMLPIGIITIVLMLLFDGGLIGLLAGILLLCAPKREFEG